MCGCGCGCKYLNLKIVDADADEGVRRQLRMWMRISDGHILEDEGADADIFIFYIIYVFSIRSGNFQ